MNNMTNTNGVSRKTTNNSGLFICAVILLCYVLFTLLQNYHSAIIQLMLLIACLLFVGKFRKEIIHIVCLLCLSCLIFLLISLCKGEGARESIALFFHYITWSILFFLIIYNLSYEKKLYLLRVAVIICILGNLLSIRILLVDGDVARMLAGAITETQKIKYYAVGVGGYGYVYAMTFLSYGVVFWLIRNPKLIDKILLWIFLISNLVYILLAAYTIAIFLSFALIIIALTTKMKGENAKFVLFTSIFVFILFFEPIIMGMNNLVQKLDLDWVEKRLMQILEANESNDFSSLRRVELYSISLNSFFSNPLFGGDSWGGHSEILDTLAQFGVFGLLLPVCFCFLSKCCLKVIRTKNMKLFYILFLVFATINTCGSSQIPVVVFFVCPLMIYINDEKTPPVKVDR